MADYPLTTKPDKKGFRESAAVDSTVKSDMEAGYRITRNRFTRVPKKWEFKYTQLSNDDKESLEAFEISVGYGSDSFNWTHPTSSTVYVVRFGKAIVYEMNESDGNEWDISIVLEQV